MSREACSGERNDTAQRGEAVMVLEYDLLPVDEAHIKREKAKARELRQSQWWKNQRGKGQCHYCKQRFPAKTLTMDHIVPISRGGTSVRKNVVPCCKECNNKKKYLLPVEWAEYVKGQL